MAEPSTSTLIVAGAGVGFASLFPGIDGNTLIGAFAGAALVVVSSKELSIPKRVAYMLISLIVGYLGAPEVMNMTPIKSVGVAAFLAASLAIVITLQLIERIKSTDITAIFRKGG